MNHQYESEILFRLMERDGFNIPSSVPPYEAEIKDYLINQVKDGYPKLMDYEAEWLLYNETEHLPAEFPIETVQNVTKATFENVVPHVYQSAILKGSTKYRDIVTGDILDAFDESKNLELVSVKMPGLTTTNGDGTKTNILTVNEDVVLCGIGDVKDELDLVTGEVTQRIGEVVFDGSEYWVRSAHEANSPMFYTSFNNLVHKGDYLNSVICDKLMVHTNHENLYYFSTSPNGISAYADLTDTYPNENWIYIKYAESEGSVEKLKQWLSQNPITVQYELATESVKTVDLTSVNESGESIPFKPLEGTMNVQSSGEPIQPTFDMSVPVEATSQNLASYIDLEMRD